MTMELRGRCRERSDEGAPATRESRAVRRSSAPHALCACLLGTAIAVAPPAAALEIFTSAETNAGFVSNQQAGGPVAIASASHPSGVTSYAEFRVDPDDQDIELQFSITPGPGGFDSTVLASAYARGHAGYSTTLTGVGIAASLGTVQFLFAVTGRMDIDGNPTPGSWPGYEVLDFNLLRVRVGSGGSSVSELLFSPTLDQGSSALVFATLLGTSAIAVDFSSPVELTVEWQGGASVQSADGDFVVSSDFLGTVGLQAVLLRDLAGQPLPGTFMTDTGRLLPVPEPQAAPLVVLGLLGATWVRRGLRDGAKTAARPKP
jgi:hypothetical protein